jgi:hypothetical protein
MTQEQQLLALYIKKLILTDQVSISPEKGKIGFYTDLNNRFLADAQIVVSNIAKQVLAAKK